MIHLSPRTRRRSSPSHNSITWDWMLFLWQYFHIWHLIFYNEAVSEDNYFPWMTMWNHTREIFHSKVYYNGGLGA